MAPLTGQLTRWNARRGFGFIRPDDGGDDVFCHASELKSGDERDLQDGDTLEYDVEYDRRKEKDRAINIHPQNSGGSRRSRSRSRGRGGGGGGRDRYDDRRGGGGGGGRDRSYDRGGRGGYDDRGGDRWEPRKKEFRAGDWECEKCGFHNFARNTECKKCGAYPPDDRNGRDRSRGRDRSYSRGRDRSYSRGRD